MNINLSPTSSAVKSFRPTNVDIIRTYTLMHPEFEGLTYSCSPPGASIPLLDLKSFGTNPVEKSVFLTPQKFSSYKVAESKPYGSRTPPEQKYPELAAECRENYVSDKALISAYRARLGEAPIVMSHYEDNSSCVFRGQVKGDEYYNRRMRERLNIALTALILKYSFRYLFTMTYDYHRLGKDIIFAWQAFSTEVTQTLRALRDKFGIRAVAVLEATKRGYPHAHIVLACDQPIEGWHDKLRDGEQIRYGKLYNFLSKRMKSPVFKLQKAGEKGLSGYLSKYVSKTTETVKSIVAGGEGSLSVEDRKCLLSCMLPVLSGVRQFRIPRSLRETIQTASLENEESALEVLTDLIRLGTCSPEGDRLLIPLLTNATAQSGVKTYITCNPVAISGLKRWAGFHDITNPEMLEDFKSMAYPVGYPDDIYTCFLDFLKSNCKGIFSAPGLSSARFLSRFAA